MQDVNWVAIIINAAVSLFLSFVMFALGMRSGKERTERMRLRDKYRELYAHINTLHEGIMSHRPKTWDHYSDSTPPCKKMIKSGEQLELVRSVFSNAEELEKVSLRYGWNFNKMCIDIGSLIIEYLKENNIPLKEEKYSVSTNYESVGNKQQRSYSISPITLLSEEERSDYVERYKNSDVGINLTYSDGSYVKYSIYLRNCDKGHLDIREILNGVSRIVESKGHDLFIERKKLLKNLDKCKKRLGKLTKEPHSFWGTLGNTFRDFFS